MYNCFYHLGRGLFCKSLALIKLLVTKYFGVKLCTIWKKSWLGFASPFEYVIYTFSSYKQLYSNELGSMTNLPKNCVYLIKAILRLFIYKALYDESYLGSKTTMTTGEWSCLISFAWDPLSCSEQAGIEKFKMKIYVSSGIRTHQLHATTSDTAP